ncbi:uncharacterized protein LOC129223036 [Uloborus diversus]|uniref:uncharacterized protein LOC129223036 n=1 Tax=Uloborus diversus TaxID=327109 RepID=UPI00240948D2|nr:uncharacterized protein LOC129223036 [Uloborus diversus]
MYEFAFTADIAKMYRQVWVSEEDQNYLLILWRNSSKSQMQEFKLRTLTYGTASAPFLATRVLQQIEMNCETENPLLSKVILNDFYMDDLLSGVNNISEGIKICSELSELLGSHSFHLRKWRSNAEEILNHIESDSRNLAEVRILPSKESKVLGLYWDSNLDCFTFKIAFREEHSVTKRHILSESAKIFDPLGLLSPCTVIIKIFYQKLWWLNTHKLIQIHGFSDASELAYAAAIYTVQTTADGSRKSSLMVAKTKVCPIKQISIPRLELNAARLLARLLQSVQVALRDFEIEIFAWTDSTVVLAWLASHPRKWKQFVANRTSEILEIIPFKSLGYVKSKENLADIASRGLNANLLIDCNLWWNGPPWLLKDSKDWPEAIQVQENKNTLAEKKLKVLNCNLSENKEFL